MAALIERNGWYYAQFYSTTQRPRQKRIALGANRKREAQKLLARLQFAYQSGQFDPWSDDPRTFDQPRPQKQPSESRTIEEALMLFLASKIKASRSEETIQTYRKVIGYLVANVGASLPLARLSPSHLEAFVMKPSLAKATRHLRYRHVKAFLSWCRRQGFIEREPLRDIEQPELPDKLPKAMGEEELDRICETIRQDYEEKRRRGFCRDNELLWLIELFRFAYYTGMRASELLRLRWRDVSLEKRLIFIRQQKNRKEQTIPLSLKAQRVLENVDPGVADSFVFRSPGFQGDERSITTLRNNVSRKFLKYRRLAGIERPISLHSARHGFCTRLAEAGKPGYVIQALARHSDIKTSMRYVHLTNEHLKQEVEDVFK